MAMIAHGNVARNKKANFNYNIIEKFEAGIVLRGVEVKSLRCGTSSISEAYVVERNNELWLQNCYIPEYQGGVLSRFDTRRDRKLLLHKKQIAKILGEMSKSGMSVVPLDVFLIIAVWQKLLLVLVSVKRIMTNVKQLPIVIGHVKKVE